MIEQTWKPIETAPKGDYVLLWWRTCDRATVGRFTDTSEKEEHDHATYGCPLSGWKTEGDGCIPKNQKDCTHWMPLPEGPVLT